MNKIPLSVNQRACFRKKFRFTHLLVQHATADSELELDTMEGHITFTTHQTKEVIINSTEITWVADPISQEGMLEKSHSNKTASHIKSGKYVLILKLQL